MRVPKLTLGLGERQVEAGANHVFDAEKAGGLLRLFEDEALSNICERGEGVRFMGGRR